MVFIDEDPDSISVSHIFKPVDRRPEIVPPKEETRNPSVEGRD